MSFVPVPCLPDLGSVTIDGGTVTIDGGNVTVDGTVSVIPAGGFTPVAESRFFATDSSDLTLLGTSDLVLPSPTPAAGQIVVVTDLSYFIELAVALALSSLDIVIRQVSDAAILWTASVGFAATLGAGSTNSATVEDIYVYGGDGEQLEMVITLAAGIGVNASVSANYGGYLATL